MLYWVLSNLNKLLVILSGISHRFRLFTMIIIAIIWILCIIVCIWIGKKYRKIVIQLNKISSSLDDLVINWNNTIMIADMIGVEYIATKLNVAVSMVTFVVTNGVILEKAIQQYHKIQNKCK